MLIHNGVKDSKTRKMVAHGLKSFSSSAKADLLARASGFFYDLPKRNSIETQTRLLNLIKVAQNDPSARVRSRLAQTLIRFNCAEANAILFQLAENDPSNEVRASAKSIIADRNKK